MAWPTSQGGPVSLNGFPSAIVEAWEESMEEDSDSDSEKILAKHTEPPQSHHYTLWRGTRAGKLERHRPISGAEITEGMKQLHSSGAPGVDENEHT